MEEISCLKRQREEETHDESLFKRQKSYKDIINLLEEEEDVPVDDLSSLISTLQEEIACSSPSSSVSNPAPSDPYEADPDVPSVGFGSGSGSGSEDENENVMRHLLEASDDELGLPNTSNITDGFDEVVGGQMDDVDLFSSVGGEGIWEFEDYEASNYYSLLQSTEIFI
ncbi:unnamed protein product [Amaranthus hypochondriacus]